jgi:hypothetical protein
VKRVIWGVGAKVGGVVLVRFATVALIDATTCCIRLSTRELTASSTVGEAVGATANAPFASIVKSGTRLQKLMRTRVLLVGIVCRGSKSPTVNPRGDGVRMYADPEATWARKNHILFKWDFYSYTPRARARQ